MGEEVVVSDEQAEEDAMVAGFAATVPAEEPAKAEPAVSEPEKPADPPPAAPEIVTPAPVEPKHITDAELREELEKVSSGFVQKFDRIFGTLGTVNSRLQELATLREKSLQIPIAAQERLKKDFPELHALLLGEEGEPPKSGETPPAVPVAAPAIPAEPAPAAPNEEEVQRRVSIGVLRNIHPDFAMVRQSAEFLAWKAKLPQAEREELDTTWDAGFVCKKLTEFKTAQLEAAKAAQDAAEAEKQRLARLSAAITPPGGSLPPGSTGLNADDEEEAAMLQAYRRQ